jgi:hypothetical protein
MSRDQNAGRSHIVMIDNSSFVRVEESKYLEATLMHQTSIQEEIKNKLMSGNACYHSVHENGGACSMREGGDRSIQGFGGET